MIRRLRGGLIMKCRYHPDEEAVAVCQKFGYGYCQKCCEAPPDQPGCVCTSPDTHCKFRQECLVYYGAKRRLKGAAGLA